MVQGFKGALGIDLGTVLPFTIMPILAVVMAMISATSTADSGVLCKSAMGSSSFLPPFFSSSFFSRLDSIQSLSGRSFLRRRDGDGGLVGRSAAVVSALFRARVAPASRRALGRGRDGTAASSDRLFVLRLPLLFCIYLALRRLMALL